MIFIVGCGGYIGSRLAAKLLKKGVAIRGLILPHEYDVCRPLINMGLDCRIGDLTTAENLNDICKGVDCVYYLAGGHFRTVQKTKEVYIGGLRRLLNALQHEKVGCFLYASNGAVYGDTSGDFLVEGKTGRPMHPFGEIVLEAEHILSQSESISNPVILRIGEVYGPEKYNPFQYCKNRLTLLGRGQNYMSLIHEYDLLSLLVMAPESLSAGIYNVTDDMPVIQSEYYRQVENICGCSFLEWVNTEKMPERILFSIHGLRSLNIKMSNNRIKDNTKYQFRYPSYQEGLIMLWHDFVQKSLPIKE